MCYLFGLFIESLRSFILEKYERGQGLIEYALIVLLIAVALIIILRAVGGELFNVFSTINDILTPAPPST